jgi:hypothetical protein
MSWFLIYGFLLNYFFVAAVGKYFILNSGQPDSYQQQHIAVPYHRSVKPMVSASHADGRGSTPGAGQISPHFSTI